jgi:hypothetical protein
MPCNLDVAIMDQMAGLLRRREAPGRNEDHGMEEHRLSACLLIEVNRTLLLQCGNACF